MTRRQLQAAERQLMIVAGMCAVAEMQGRPPSAACWRELFVLLGLCGCGW